MKIWIVFCTLMSGALSLTLDERNELLRKFKYYLSSVKPNTAPNRVTNLNGTFFGLRSELHLLSTVPSSVNDLNLELFLIVGYVDDRLVLRELQYRFRLPLAEFKPWLPELITSPADVPWHVDVYLDPRNGAITVFYKLQLKLGCTFDWWRHPFQLFDCTLTIRNVGDERLLLESVRDLRSTTQQRKIPLVTDNSHNIQIGFSYRHKWHSSILSTLLPSLLLFCVVVFAQWKRRKVQVLVAICALLGVIIIQSTHRSGTVVTLEDLWLSTTLLHIVCVFLIDLTLPARTYRYMAFIMDGNGVEEGDGKGEHPPSKRLRSSTSSIETAVVVDVKRFRKERKLTKTTNWRHRPQSSSSSSVVCLHRDRLDAILDAHNHHRSVLVTINTRKKIALASIIICYLIFVLSYFIFVFLIII